MVDEREPHETATLLPWYLNGTLTAQESRLVEGHVASCGACARELASLRRLRPALAAAIDSHPGPSPDLFSRIKARIETRKVLAVSSPVTGRWWERLGERVFGLMPPRLAPALAVGLIVVQFGALAVMGRILYRSAEGPIYTPAAGPEAVKPAAGQGVRFRVAFHENAKERDIRAALGHADARIVEGPTAAGFYIIEAPAAGDPQRFAAALQRPPAVVRFVEPLTR